jgi:hypothetical protein
LLKTINLIQNNLNYGRHNYFMPKPMNDAQKKRIDQFRKVTAARKKLGKDGAIFLRKGGEITSATIVKASKRWNTRKGHTMMSYDEPIKGIKASDVALRLVSKEILRAADKINMPPETKSIVRQIAEHRELTIAGTKIRANRGMDLLVIKLVNRVGEKKALQIIRLMQKSTLRARKLLSKKGIIEKTGMSDAFANMPTRYSSIMLELEMDMENKHELANRLKDPIQERKKDIAKLEGMDVPNKQTHLKNLREEKSEAIIELTRFMTEHKIQ